jgi:predicted  nucleic acid-binding Zn-ribbon protein
MAARITTGILLEHIQAMKGELLKEISGLGLRMDRLELRLDKMEDRLDLRIDSLEQRMVDGFEDARLHRTALQEDLDATIRMQYRQNKTIARLQKRSAS